MPKSKHRKMTRNTPKAVPQGQAPAQPIQSTQAPAGTTVVRGQTAPASTPRTTTMSSPYNRASSGKAATLPVIDYVGKELKTIGILTAIVVVIIIVLSFVLR